METQVEQLIDELLSSDTALGLARTFLGLLVVGFLTLQIRRIVFWLSARFTSAVRLYDVVELRDQKKYKVERLTLRGVFLHGQDESRIKVIPLSEWVKMEKTIIVQSLSADTVRRRTTTK